MDTGSCIAALHACTSAVADCVRLFVFNPLVLVPQPSDRELEDNHQVRQETEFEEGTDRESPVEEEDLPSQPAPRQEKPKEGEPPRNGADWPFGLEGRQTYQTHLLSSLLTWSWLFSKALVVCSDLYQMPALNVIWCW